MRRCFCLTCTYYLHTEIFNVWYTVYSWYYLFTFRIHPKEHFQKMYTVDDVYYVDEVRVIAVCLFIFLFLYFLFLYVYFCLHLLSDQIVIL